MATPKKKHLIELMIEAGVKWPDGAEYAAQDKNQDPAGDNSDLVNIIAFYSSKPTKRVDDQFWLGDDDASKDIQLPFLCRNWHQTIVTREQYAEAVAAADNGSTTNQVRESEDVPASQPAAQLYSGVTGVMPSESIESLLAEIKAKREKRDALVAKADALALEIASIEQRINDKLKEYGFAIFQLAAASEPEQLAITDWRDLRVGDVIECVAYGDERDAPYPGGWASRNIGNEQVVSEINVKSGKISIKKGQDSGRAFRFIRRP